MIALALVLAAELNPATESQNSNWVREAMKPVPAESSTAECLEVEGGWIIIHPKVETSGFLVRDQTFFAYATIAGTRSVGEWKDRRGNYVLKYTVKMGAVPKQTSFPKEDFYFCRPPF